MKELKLKNIPIETIMEVTELTETEINKVIREWNNFFYWIMSIIVV